MKTILTFLLNLLAAAALLGVGFVIGQNVSLPLPVLTGAETAAVSPMDAGPVNTDLIREAWDLLKKRYVDQAALDSKKLTYAAIAGMVDALGDTGHSRFLSPEALKAEQNFTAGEFEGIGALLQAQDGHPVIVSPFEGSPAQKAGLHAGDVILKVDGEDVAGLPLNEVVKKIVGPAGTEVKLTVQDVSLNSVREVAIIRARIQIQNVTHVLLPDGKTGVMRINGFSKGVGNELEKAVKDLEAQGAEKLVLDLRNNPGGLLDEAVQVASLFLREGNVLLEKDSSGRSSEVGVKMLGFKTDLPLTVLINTGSASASEIVSGALKDAGRAALIGEKTFGAGTVLLSFDLSDGSAILIATKEWLTPAGQVIWHQGIAPDQTISLGEGVMPLTPEALKGMTQEQIDASGDAQLLEAIR